MYQCSFRICFFLFLFHFFSFPFLHKYCRCRAALMSLAVLINCDSGPRNKHLHLNSEQHTVHYSACLLLMSLYKVPSFLQFLTFFFFLPPASPQLISHCQLMSYQNYPYGHFLSDTLINRATLWSLAWLMTKIYIIYITYH